jgi:DNA-binding LacI/PurR family transcriptional regulator
MRTKKRPSVKQVDILEHLRGLILRGQLKPGARVPARTEIERLFRTSTVTAQRAFDRLVEDGFVEVQGKRGTFVVERPPHLHHYALCFPSPMHSGDWVRFWTVLSNVARSMEKTHPLRFSIYSGISREVAGSDYRALLADVNARRLAGLIFATNPYLVERTPILERPGLPRVAMMTSPLQPGVLAVDLDSRAFLERAVDFLVSRNRRRLAVLVVPGFQHPLRARLEEVFAARGLKLNPAWVQMGFQAEAAWTVHLIELLMRGPADERPDGLIVVDDNLVESACRGLLQSGVRVPADVEVVAHCNFPPPVASIMPISRLGYDIFHVMETCVELLERRRRSEDVAEMTRMAPQFEWEVRQEHRLPSALTA